MADSSTEHRIRHIEARVETYLHSAKRMALGVFGATGEHDYNSLTVEVATALVNLEAAHVIAEAQAPKP